MGYNERGGEQSGVVPMEGGDGDSEEEESRCMYARN